MVIQDLWNLKACDSFNSLMGSRNSAELSIREQSHAGMSDVEKCIHVSSHAIMRSQLIPVGNKLQSWWGSWSLLRTRWWRRAFLWDPSDRWRDSPTASTRRWCPHGVDLHGLLLPECSADPIILQSACHRLSEKSYNYMESNFSQEQSLQVLPLNSQNCTCQNTSPLEEPFTSPNASIDFAASQPITNIPQFCWVLSKRVLIYQEHHWKFSFSDIVGEGHFRWHFTRQRERNGRGSRSKGRILRSLQVISTFRGFAGIWRWWRACTHTCEAWQAVWRHAILPQLKAKRTGRSNQSACLQGFRVDFLNNAWEKHVCLCLNRISKASGS